MCLGIPGEIVAIVDADEQIATVDVGGVQRDVSVRLLAEAGVGVGDWVLVHVGFALSQIDAAEAAATLDQIRRLGRAWDEELQAFMETEIV